MKEECKTCENKDQCDRVFGEIFDEVKKRVDNLTEDGKLGLIGKGILKLGQEQRDYMGIIVAGLTDLNERIEKIEKILNVKTYDFIGRQ